MKKKIEYYLVIIAYALLVSGLLFSSSENIRSPWITIYTSLVIIASFTAKQLIIELKGMWKAAFYSLAILDFILIVYISLFTKGTSFKIYYFVLMYQLVFNIKKSRAVCLSVVFFIADMAANYMKTGITDMAGFIKYEFYNFPAYLMVMIILLLLKYITDVNKNLSEAQKELNIKNIQLNEAYNNMKEAYRKNEDYLIMKEKNKLAREIHDTVGHTLTTALVEMEASQVLNTDNRSLASQKLELAIKQVRKGLNEVRNSVSALNNDIEKDYYKCLTELIEDTKKHTGIAVRCDIDDISSESNELKKCIYRSLQEGMTNSIRHGEATALLFKLKYEGDYLNFSLEDNGKGCSYYRKGFGINAMEERVREFSGKLEIMTEPGEGFNIYIKFLVHKKNVRREKV